MMRKESMKSILAFLKTKYFKFSLTSLFFVLWVVWIGNYFLLLGLGIIFDYYITKKVNWTFWKKRNVEKGKRSSAAEWVDALIFAAIAATLIRMFFIEAYTIPTSSMERVMHDKSLSQYRGHFSKPTFNIPKNYTCHTPYIPKDSTLISKDSTTAATDTIPIE